MLDDILFTDKKHTKVKEPHRASWKSQTSLEEKVETEEQNNPETKRFSGFSSRNWTAYNL